MRKLAIVFSLFSLLVFFDLCPMDGQDSPDIVMEEVPDWNQIVNLVKAGKELHFYYKMASPDNLQNLIPTNGKEMSFDELRVRAVIALKKAALCLSDDGSLSFDFSMLLKSLSYGARDYRRLVDSYGFEKKPEGLGLCTMESAAAGAELVFAASHGWVNTSRQLLRGSLFSRNRPPISKLRGVGEFDIDEYRKNDLQPFLHSALCEAAAHGHVGIIKLLAEEFTLPIFFCGPGADSFQKGKLPHKYKENIHKVMAHVHFLDQVLEKAVEGRHSDVITFLLKNMTTKLRISRHKKIQMLKVVAGEKGCKELVELLLSLVKYSKNHIGPALGAVRNREIRGILIRALREPKK